MKCKYILFFIILLTACQQKREVSTSFYYWKTVYKKNKVENASLAHFKSKKIYVRIMDVDLDINQNPVPIAPIVFADSIPKKLKIVPVVFIVNQVLTTQSEAQLTQLAHRILTFVNAKIKQAGQNDYQELQIDCDWTEKTRNNYFYLLKKIKQFNSTKYLSSTLRLHQLKNQEKSGIPPVDEVLLMCYNMGNLRKYGTQNSILDVAEFKKYAGQNLHDYPLAIDVAFPLFSWSVIFRNGQYAGISHKISLLDLKNTSMFAQQANGLYLTKTNLPAFGLIKNDLVRHEQSKLEDIKALAEYLSSNLPNNAINLIYYHLDQTLLKHHENKQLEEISDILR